MYLIKSRTLLQTVLLDPFATAIKHGGKIFETPGETRLRDIRIADKVYESAGKGGVCIAA